MVSQIRLGLLILRLHCLYKFQVVFRHIPSGKSFTKPPKNLFSNKKETKRKLNEDGRADDSVYNFDDFDDGEMHAMQSKAKTSFNNGGNLK